jgi:hypothetical protein
VFILFSEFVQKCWRLVFLKKKGIDWPGTCFKKLLKVLLSLLADESHVDCALDSVFVQ